MEISPISTKRIYQSIIEQFIEHIRNGKLEVGQKLPPERSLVEMFQVSRASIREAFSAMEVIGLIEVRPGEGSVITEMNIAPFINTISPLLIKNEHIENELLEFRKMIELQAVELAAKKYTHEKLSTLGKGIELAEKAIDNNDSAAGVEADILFHKSIFELTGNMILIKAAECVSCLLENSVRFNREKILSSNHDLKELFDQHLSIYKAIKEGNTQLAKERMEKQGVSRLLCKWNNLA